MNIKDTHIVINPANAIRFVDYAIGIFPELNSKNSVKKAIKNRLLYVNKNLATTGIWIKNDDVIDLIVNDAKSPKPFPLEIEVIFEDDYLAIVNKPSGIVVSGNQYRTLENCLVDQLEKSTQLDAYNWAKPVHRIDSATCGLVLFAKTQSANQLLSKMFESKEMTKGYISVVTHADLEDQLIEIPIDGKEAVSKVEVIGKVNSIISDELSLVRMSPITGRTHQLRIHCHSIGHPIVGDQLYGEKGNTMLHKGLFLNANSLSFQHPFTEQHLEFKLPIPLKFLSLMKREERRWKKYNSN